MELDCSNNPLSELRQFCLGDQFPQDPLTMEIASIITETLKLSNDRYAMTLARKSEIRFMFRFFALRPKFAEYRTKVGNANLTDIECFLGMVTEKISHKATQIVKQSWQRYERYNALLNHVFKIGARSKFPRP